MYHYGGETDYNRLRRWKRIETGVSGRIERSENVKDVSQYIEKIGEMIERKRVLLGE